MGGGRGVRNRNISSETFDSFNRAVRFLLITDFAANFKSNKQDQSIHVKKLHVAQLGAYCY